VGKPPCGAEPRIELGPALQQADALPTHGFELKSNRIELGYDGFTGLEKKDEDSRA
jgi:hypothetical protein